MDASQFTMWLQGFAELNAEPPTKEQWQSIREHLQLVFKKVAPGVAPRMSVDLKDSPAVKELLEKARREGGFAWPATPQPFYMQPEPFKPGTITC